MNFDFNIGAIVKLGIFGFATPLYKLGKVIEVTPTEVVIVPQLNVYRESDNGPSSLDEYCTADALHEVLHIRRQLIAYWTQANYSSLANISSKSFSDYTLNLYDKNTGICKGEGANCCNIVESTSPFFFSQLTSANDGIHHELSHCRF